MSPKRADVFKAIVSSIAILALKYKKVQIEAQVRALMTAAWYGASGEPAH